MHSPPSDNLHNENGVLQGNGASRPEEIFFRMLIILADKIAMMEPNVLGRPRAVNVTAVNVMASMKEGKIVKFMFGASVCSGIQQEMNKMLYENSKSIAMLRQPKTPCRLVVPNVQSTEARIPETMCHVTKGEKQDESREGCKILENPFMLVETIANKKDRKRVANYLNRNLETGDPSTCICDMEIIKEHGFDHIITIGESHAGVLFLDCYGRVFEWSSMCNVLWSLGDY
ncbi:8026_t:CDS:2 [Paraglomus brasilianum]|uniref:8026_t:CDS:1 n=1 Tax=Paraglomus brasilianum TaxID=144538 RepID=A0A9N9CQF7_9GLOM|nr:8026_t:CDS:2 [Paraglomus brasilianum]